MPLETILLPGMMCDHRLFGPQMDLGAIRVPEIPLRHSMAEMAQVLLEDLPDRFALGGLSMGGILAMEILAQAPERVAALALMDTNPLSEQAEVKTRRADHLKAVAEGRLLDVMRDDLKPNYLCNGPLKPSLMRLCMDMAMHLGPLAFQAQSIALRDRRDQTETLGAFKGPALVLCGREDRLCPVERHELMHKLMPGSRLVVIDAAGHMPTLEAPEATNAALAQWMETAHA